MNTTSQPTSDNSQNKAIAIIGYIIPILFFIPLLSEAKNNAFAKFHANQQLNLLLFWVIVNVVGVVPIIGWIIWPFATLAGLVLMIMGIINAAGDKMVELPIIGKYALIK